MSNPIHSGDFYRTKDYFIASFLLADGILLTDWEKVNGEVWFILSERERCIQRVEEFMKDIAVCSPSELHRQLKRIKAVINQCY